MSRRFYCFVCGLALAASLAAYTADLTPGRKSALERITAQSLKGHLSFLASDALEGRNTPSPGLEIAAEYIAAQFRRAGLKPAGDNGYFQTGHLLSSEHSAGGAGLSIESGATKISIAAKDLRAIWTELAEFSGVQPVKINPGETMTEAIEDKVVLIAQDRPGSVNLTLQSLAKWKPAAVIFVQSNALNAPEVRTRLDEPGRQPTFTQI